MIYTVTPPVFDQVALVADYPGRKPLHRFPQTTVFRGHFEQGGEPIIQDTTIEIKRVVHFREFVLNGPKLETQHYLLLDGAVTSFFPISSRPRPTSTSSWPPS